MPAPSPPRAALGGLVVSVVLAVGAFAAAFVGAGDGVAPAVVLGVATAGMMASLILLSAGRRGGGGAVALAAAVVVLVVGGGLAAAFLVGRPTGADAPLLGGLPTGAAVLIYGAGLAPAFLIPLLYAWTFDRTTLPPEVLERVRTEADRARRDPDRVRAEAERLRDETDGESP